MVYTLTKIFGVDEVKTQVFNHRSDALAELKANLTLCCEDDKYEEYEKNNETYFIVSPNETDPTEYIEFVLRRCEIK